MGNAGMLVGGGEKPQGRSKVAEFAHAVNHLSISVDALVDFRVFVQDGEYPKADKADSIEPPTPSLAQALECLPEEIHRLANNLREEVETLKGLLF